MNDFYDAIIGDKVYCEIYGEGNIVRITNEFIVYNCNSLNYLVNKDGKFPNAIKRTLSYLDNLGDKHEQRPKLRVPWDKVPIDTKVIANDYKRYYAGDFKVFNNGATFWSSDNSWKPKCLALAEDLTIDGILYLNGMT